MKKYERRFDMLKDGSDKYLKEKKNASDFKKFVKELAELSKKYGVAIKSIGGVTIGEIKDISYSDDETSGDLEYRVIWK